MLQKAISILLISSVLLQGGTKIGMYAYFKINQDYITEIFCINKNKPAIQCNGQCFLSKQIKSQEEKEKKANTQNKGIENNLFHNKYLITIATVFSYKKSVFNKNYKLSLYEVFGPSIFRPPLA